MSNEQNTPPFTFWVSKK